MKKAILLIISIAFTGLLAGQTSVSFGYDAAGNRTSRTIIWEEETIDTTQFVENATELKNTFAENKTPEKYSATLGEQNIQIFPNPTNGTFTLKVNDWDNESIGEMKLYGLQGNTIAQQQITKAQTEIKFKNHTDGTYLLTVTLNGKEETWKVIKR